MIQPLGSPIVLTLPAANPHNNKKRIGLPTLTLPFPFLTTPEQSICHTRIDSPSAVCAKRKKNFLLPTALPTYMKIVFTCAATPFSSTAVITKQHQRPSHLPVNSPITPLFRVAEPTPPKYASGRAG
ncbi:unnamed protein product, partial [Ectocarpus fasciculatus]